MFVVHFFLHRFPSCHKTMENTSIEQGEEDWEGTRFFVRLKDTLLKCYYFFQLNGGYFALYGIILPGILMNILSAVFNECILCISLTRRYQGGCSFPYISEVGREGLNRVIFVTSTVIIIVPWLIFSAFFLFTSWAYAQLVIPSLFHRGVFDFCQLVHLHSHSHLACVHSDHAQQHLFFHHKHLRHPQVSGLSRKGTGGSSPSF